MQRPGPDQGNHMNIEATRTAVEEGAAGARPSAVRRIARFLATFTFVLAAAIGLVLVGTGAAYAAGNDYPYATQTNTGAVDPWGFTERQCVSFAAWRAHQRGHDMHNTTATPWGNATHWDTEATALHVAVNTTPTVGAFAQWHANEKRTWTSGSATYWFAAGPTGHVAYVAAVYTDGTVLLEDYNGFGGSRVYGSKRLPRTAVPRFIHYAG